MTGRASDPEDRVIAAFDGGQVYKSDIAAALRFGLISDNQREVIETIATNRWMAQRAEEKSLHETPENRWTLWFLKTRTGVDDLLREKSKSPPPSESQLREKYREEIDRFRKPAMFSFRYIFCDTTELSSTEAVREVRKRFEDAVKTVAEVSDPFAMDPLSLSLEEFVRIAAICGCGEEATPTFAGPFTLEEPIQNVLKETALSLEPGQLSPLLSTKYGYQIIRLESRTPAATAEFEQVKDQLRAEVESAARTSDLENYFQSLKEDRSKYAIDEGMLDRLLPGASRRRPQSNFVVVVGDMKWTPEDIKEYMTKVHLRDWLMNREFHKAKEIIWEKLVLPTLLMQEAEKAGFADAATQTARERLQREAFLAGKWLEEEVETRTAAAPTPSTAEAKSFYERHPEQFKVPPTYRIVRYEIANPKPQSGSTPAELEFHMRESETRLRAMLDSIRGGASPAQARKELSASPNIITAATETHPVGQRFSNEIWEALKILENGEWIGHPVREKESVWIAFLLEKKPGTTVSFESSLNQIRDRLQREQRERIRSEVVQEVRESAIGSLKLTAEDGG